MPDRIPFTKQLLQQLKQQGYTHIQQRGHENKPESTLHSKDDPEDGYILIPWKIEVLLFEDAQLQLLEIDSTDVTDMLEVEFGINFWVEMPPFPSAQ